MEESPRRKYTDDEKKQLLANLELEVKDRVRQFEAYLAEYLEAFKWRHENEVTRIPRAVRILTMAEFADKYDGDVNKAIQTMTKAKLPDASVKKRKLELSADGSQQSESSRATKNARVASPQKRETAGARPRLVKTPGARLRRQPTSPELSTGSTPRTQKTAVSPGKVQRRVLPSSSFDPALPKTPAFPRKPRANESLLSVNGSPLANPYDPYSGLGAGLPAQPAEESQAKLKRQRSINFLYGPSLIQNEGHQDNKPPALEVVLSIKVPTINGTILEFDPLATSTRDLEALEDVSDEAKRAAKEELSELGALMEKLGKWSV